MPQQTSLLAVLQSVSAAQVRTLSATGPQTSFDVASETRTHARPCVVSQSASALQKRGHSLADAHSF
jgi:hypothetical protein